MTKPEWKVKVLEVAKELDAYCHLTVFAIIKCHLDIVEGELVVMPTNVNGYPDVPTPIAEFIKIMRKDHAFFGRVSWENYR